MTRTVVFIIALLVSSAGAALGQDVAAGEQAFRKCSACHSVGEDAKNKLGPELNGLAGRKFGTAEGFNYSDANKNAAFTWDETTFLDYIKDPRAKVPGTKMIFAGIKDEKEAKDLWAYLAQFDANGKKK